MDDLERALLDAGRVEPGPDVRTRVLAATAPLVRRDGGRLDRIWFSRTWHIAAAFAVLILLVLDTVSARTGGSLPLAHDLRPAETTRAVAMAASEAGLPPDETIALCAQAIAAARAAARTMAATDAFPERSTQ